MKTIIAIIIIFLLFGIIGNLDYESKQEEQDNYCEMVKIYKQTNGTKGWPAYNGEGVCK